MATINRIRVRRKPGRSPHLGILSAGGRNYICALGRSGIGSLKCEGDGLTPMGRFKVLNLFYRKEHVKRSGWQAPIWRIRENDGWCDAPDDPNYNQAVKLPYNASHERMHRADRLYDICIVLDYNITKRVRNRGSAIFFHLQTPECGPTEGCVALSRPDMLNLLRLISDKTTLEICR